MGRRVGGRKKKECFFNNLTDELLIEVFIRLPSSKEAIRCQAVCNRWFTLISSDYFRNASLIHNSNYDKKPFAFVSTADQKSLYVFELSTEQDLPKQVSLGFLCSGRSHNYRIRLEGSSGDLILCSGRIFCFRNSSGTDFYIVNLMTKQWVMLPPSPPENKHFILTESVGFLIMDNAEYVVLRFFPCSGSKFSAQMFSSERGMWTEVVVTSPRNLNLITTKTWIVSCGRMFYTFTRKRSDVVDSVLALDPFTNDPDQFLCVIDFPLEARDIRYLACKLGECGGLLRFAQLILQPSGFPCISIWELEDDYRKGKWTLVHKTIPTNTTLRLPTLGRDTMRLISVLAFHPFNEDLICFVVGNDLLVVYNIQTHEVESYPCPSVFWYKELVGLGSLSAVPIIHNWWPTPVRQSLWTQSLD